MACSDEWQVAGRRKGAARRGKQPSNPKLDSHQVPDCIPDKQKIINAMSELRGENFWMEWKDLLSERFLSNASGSSEQNGDVSLQHCVCYEREALKELGFIVLTENEEGKRAVYQPTLFYLMHCGKALYNNLLWRNWTPQMLKKILIIGNSFHGIQERMLQREFERDYSFLSNVISVCDEASLPCSPRFLDVFNDTALIQFPLENLNKLPESIWTEPSEPLYQHCQDLEIIQKEKKN
ncbi:SRR1-like protein [Labeo rohita]|uniref:SRR1-like protein n=1 Tax=Labeo rohita TaxID=84645 RepID=A0ABQ8MGM7_LABRO|nr:SRR1-like protein [Labeo rohita]